MRLFRSKLGAGTADSIDYTSQQSDEAERVEDACQADRDYKRQDDLILPLVLVD